MFVDLATLEPHEDQWEYLSTLDRLSPAELTRTCRSFGCDPRRNVGRPPAARHLDPDHRRRPANRPHHPRQHDHGRRGGPAASAVVDAPARRLTRQSSVLRQGTSAALAPGTRPGSSPVRRGTRRRLAAAPRARRAAGSHRAAGGQPSRDHRRLPCRGRAAGSRSQPSSPRSSTPPYSELRQHDLGVLEAPPGAGKTVMACALIAARGVPRSCWSTARPSPTSGGSRISRLLGFKLGQLGGGRTKLTGVVDVAIWQTLTRRPPSGHGPGRYGQVIVDERHHVPAPRSTAAVRAIPARGWVGLTATPYRRDGLDDLIGFQLGPVRHTFTMPTPTPSKVPVPTDPAPCSSSTRPRSGWRTQSTCPSRAPSPASTAALAEDQSRNEIFTDESHALGRGRHCLVLAQRTGHVDHLAGALGEARAGPGRPQGRHGRQAARRRGIGRLQPAIRIRLAAACGRDGPLRRRRLRLSRSRHAVPGQAPSRSRDASSIRRPHPPSHPGKPDRRGCTTTTTSRCQFSRRRPS